MSAVGNLCRISREIIAGAFFQSIPEAELPAGEARFFICSICTICVRKQIFARFTKFVFDLRA